MSPPLHSATSRKRAQPSLGISCASRGRATTRTDYASHPIYDEGTPQLSDVRLILAKEDYPVPTIGFETQNFVAPEDRFLTVSGYLLGGTPNTDTFCFDTQTGKLRNISDSPETYDEAEGIFPDGQYTLVEHAPSRGVNWPLVDLFKMSLDGSGQHERITYFSDFRGKAGKGLRGVISDDGTKMLFQLGQSGQEAGQGHSIFLLDLHHKDLSISYLHKPKPLAYDADAIAPKD